MVQSKERGLVFRTLILSAYILSGTVAGTAQVTIGSLLEPAQGALLDLKDQNPDSDNVTSKSGGLLLPRVELNALNDFSLLPLTDTKQITDHTGLLVYNLRTDVNLSLERGVYHWDGSRWKKLNRITTTEGVSVKKIIYQGTSPNSANIASLGIFEFRLQKEGSEVFPQFKFTSGASNQTVHWQVNQYWDMNTSSEATGLTKSGYDFSLHKATTLSDWTNCMDLMSDLERNEIWIADLENDQMYQVQFLILKGNSNNNTYIIIARKY